jgi:hypothetical protein
VRELIAFSPLQSRIFAQETPGVIVKDETHCNGAAVVGISLKQASLTLPLFMTLTKPNGSLPSGSKVLVRRKNYLMALNLEPILLLIEMQLLLESEAKTHTVRHGEEVTFLELVHTFSSSPFSEFLE